MSHLWSSDRRSNAVFLPVNIKKKKRLVVSIEFSVFVALSGKATLRNLNFGGFLPVLTQSQFGKWRSDRMLLSCAGESDMSGRFYAKRLSQLSSKVSLTLSPIRFSTQMYSNCFSSLSRESVYLHQCQLSSLQVPQADSSQRTRRPNRGDPSS